MLNQDHGFELPALYEYVFGLWFGSPKLMGQMALQYLVLENSPKKARALIG